jgi:hypothetical protein
MKSPARGTIAFGGRSAGRPAPFFAFEVGRIAPVADHRPRAVHALIYDGLVGHYRSLQDIVVVRVFGVFRG